MAVFHYLVKNDEGARSEGDIRADTMDLALHKLTSNGQIVITLKEVDTTFDFLGPFLDEINLTFENKSCINTINARVAAVPKSG